MVLASSIKPVERQNDMVEIEKKRGMGFKRKIIVHCHIKMIS